MDCDTRPGKRYVRRQPSGLEKESASTVDFYEFCVWNRTATNIQGRRQQERDYPDERLSPHHHGGASGRHKSLAFCGCWRLVTRATQHNSFPVVTDKSLRQSEAILSSPVLRKLRPGSWSIHNASRQGNNFLFLIPFCGRHTDKSAQTDVTAAILIRWSARCRDSSTDGGQLVIQSVLFPFLPCRFLFGCRIYSAICFFYLLHLSTRFPFNGH